MSTRWFLLIDQSVDGVLTSTQDAVVANQLRKGLLDARLMWTRAPHTPGSTECSGYRKHAFFPLDETQAPASFVEKRRLAQLRLPAFLFWRDCFLDQIQRFEQFYYSIDPYIAHELGNSTAEAPSARIIEYALDADLSPQEAHTYLSLQLEENTRRRLQLHALATKHARAINACHTEDDRTRALDALRADLFGRKNT